ncbi:MAG TPA: hypothetical protein VF468_09535 [Actinomycetota bacterium]|nr:hypothetical protein [Actinomycetota bacterium]
MTTGSNLYGVHHAGLVGAMAWLLTHPDTPPTEVELRAVLAYRCAVLDAQRQLLDRAIRGADVHRVLFGHNHTRSPLHAVAAAPPLALAELVEQVPRHPDVLPALTDALTEPVSQTPPVVAAWRDAARHALLATDIVTSAGATGWADHPGLAWRLVADTATTIEALTVLDGRLAATPAARRLLPGWARLHRKQASVVRMLANHTARVAGSGPLDPGTDTLARSLTVSRPMPLTHPAQLPDGIRAAAVLAARTVPTASELRKIAAAHADLAHTCARLLPDQLSELWDSYTDRAAAYRDLAGAASRVASIHRGGGLVLVQTAELTRLLHHAAATSPRDAVAGVLADLDTAYPGFSRALAGRVSHGLQTGAYLVPHPHTLEHRWEHPRPGHPTAARLHETATRLGVGDRSADRRAADQAAGLRRPGRRPALTPDQVTRRPAAAPRREPHPTTGRRPARCRPVHPQTRPPRHHRPRRPRRRPPRPAEHRRPTAHADPRRADHNRAAAGPRTHRHRAHPPAGRRPTPGRHRQAAGRAARPP